jgi:hypothetical protein
MISFRCYDDSFLDVTSPDDSSPGVIKWPNQSGIGSSPVRWGRNVLIKALGMNFPGMNSPGTKRPWTNRPNAQFSPPK